jgi:hypothetical protein
MRVFVCMCVFALHVNLGGGIVNGGAELAVCMMCMWRGEIETGRACLWIDWILGSHGRRRVPNQSVIS